MVYSSSRQCAPPLPPLGVIGVSTGRVQMVPYSFCGLGEGRAEYLEPADISVVL